MEGNEIDYSNTIIYKISCKDENVKELYVGHTTNFVQRKQAHKYSCINKESAYNNSKVYNMIRTNGGWNNWSMDIVNFYNCRNLSEAREKEQEYYISLKATLNSVEPFPKPKEVIDKIKPLVKKERNNIKKVRKMKDKELVVVNEIIIGNKYSCTTCLYSCNKESDYKKHVATRKHNKNTIHLQQLNKKVERKCICNCGKEYTYRQGLSAHKKTCIYKTVLPTADISSKDILNETIKDNAEYKIIILDLIKTNNELIKRIDESNINLLKD